MKVDPSNRYLWRFNPRRLDAEQVRDALLAVSGELDAAAGGPAGDGNATRRSVYTMKKRNNPNELLRALDTPAGHGASLPLHAAVLRAIQDRDPAAAAGAVTLLIEDAQRDAFAAVAAGRAVPDQFVSAER